MSNRYILLFFFALLLLLAGCVNKTANSGNPVETMPTPTIAPFFAEREGAEANIVPAASNSEEVPTVASLFTTRVAPTPRPSPTALPTLPPREPPIGQTDVYTSTVFADKLDDNWEILEPTGAMVDTDSDVHVFAGQRSIAFTPESIYTALYFAIKPTTTNVYPLQQVLGVSFWLNGGDNFIDLDQLAVSVIGSNNYVYWVADDNSVEFPQGESFSETRLYFLGLNRSIPPETWVQIYLPLDALRYDPEYQNVVGFYLKNVEDFTNTIYVDEVSLVMLAGLENTVLATATPMPTASKTPTPTSTAQIEQEMTPTATASVEQITIPVPSNTPVSEPETCVVSPPPGWELYTIQSGDSISSLAFARGESAEFVVDVNCLGPGALLSVGQEIWLPPLGPEP